MNIKYSVPSFLLAGALAGAAWAGDPVPSQHQLMKACMAKQKQADSGKSKEELRAFCKDVAKTQRDADKQQPPSKR